MQPIRKIGYCFLAYILYATGLFGQYKLDQPVFISKENGLPTNEVRCIRKGNDGFIWIGTTEGLCRFDGQQIRVFQKQKDDTKGPFDNLILQVLPLGKEVWMTTGQGVSVLNAATETFRHYQLGKNGKLDSVSRQFNQSAYVLYEDHNGDIWVGTREMGLWLYDKKKDNFRRFSFPDSAYPQIAPLLGPNANILSIEASETNDSIIWAGTAGGLEEVNKYNGHVNWYVFPQAENDYQISLNAFRRLYHHDDGLLYVGSWAAGVNVFDPVQKTFKPLVVKDSPGKVLLTESIANITRKNKYEIWITTTSGLVLYNTLQQDITWYKLNHPMRSQYYGIDYIDESNRVWHININGLQYFDPTVQQFTSNSFAHLSGDEWAYCFNILTDAKGERITVCPRVTNGIYVFDKPKQEWTKFPFKAVKPNLLVRGFVETSPGNYIISAEEGLFAYNKSTGILAPARNQPPLSFKRWGHIVKDDLGNIWIAADAEGLVKWNIKTNEYRIYKQELIAGKSGEGVGRANTLFKDSYQNIWSTRKGGLSVHLAKTDSILNFMYEDNPANSFPGVSNFAEDKNNRLWVSGGDGWYGYVDLKNPGKGIVQKFDLKEKGIDGYFTNLATDLQGNVWGFTSRELVKINADNMELSVFSFEYGVKRVDFYHFSFLPSGEMVFGERNGVTIADPEGLKRNAELPTPYIAQLKLLNHPVNLLTYLKKGTLDLKHNQNFLTIYFSAKAFTMASGVRFRYRLKEFDNWVEDENTRVANYTNVPPGDYVFQLQAANNEGVWNEKMLEMPIHIATPWWQTWWFRSLVLLAAAAITYWLYRSRIDQVRKKEKMKSQYEKKLANVEMTALLAQMNPHFLFNSLNSIDSYIIKNESGKASEYLNNFARLMRLILQHSRSNYISLKDELEALDLYLQMEKLRFGDKFQYEIKLGPTLDPSAIVIPPMLIQPYVENAIWHGLMHKSDGSTRKVEILVGQQDNNLVCVIQDNGIGREKAAELKSHKAGNHKRSMGMQITRDRIEMINKLYNSNTSLEIVDLKDEEGKPSGTKVEITIPV